MLGTSGVVGSSGDGGGGGEVVVGAGGGSSSIMVGIGDDEKERGGGGGGAGELFESGDRSGGGNRWPRQETIALLKIRSDMDVVFRDSSLKGPLWEEVSRKMAELGYHRSAKKCKEKFENVYKYHKRTKDGRVGKSDGKTYRFFDQLEALEAHHHHPPLPQPQTAAQAAVPVTMMKPAGATSVTVPSSPHLISVVHAPPTIIQQQQQQQQQQQVQQHHKEQAMPLPVQSNPVQVEQQSIPSSPSATASPSSSSSSSTSSDEELLGRRKRKRKWKDFFERIMREVIEKQEQLQNRFLEAVEKREQDQLNREEAWKMQEITRLNREHEILVQERSMVAAKDAALISFLQKLSEQQQIPLHLPAQAQTQTQQPQTQPQVQVQENRVSLRPTPLPPSQPVAQLPPQQATVVAANVEVQKSNNGEPGEGEVVGASSSRWPKAEVEALINLRTRLDQKYQENGPKGPLWEEISAAMRKLGYNRNAKRCKEKWENINKYFKKVKESNKKRPDDSKTCPYFHQLDALYREKTASSSTTTTNLGSVGPILVQPEQQWGLAHDDDDDDGDAEEEDDDDQGSGGYEIVANNAAAAGGGGSMSATTTATTAAE